MLRYNRVKTLMMLCCVPGTFLAASGLCLIFLPNIAEILFDLKDGHAITGNLLAPSVGIRQLAFGLIIVALAYQRRAQALGTVMLIGAIIPLADFLNFYPTIGVLSSLRHGAIVPIVMSLGVCLLVLGRDFDRRG